MYSRPGQKHAGLAGPSHSLPSSAKSPHTTPEELRPFPKAAARKSITGGRKRARTLILTDTPVKNSLEAELAAIQEKKCRRTAKVPVKKVIFRNRPAVESDTSSDQNEPTINDTSDDELEDFVDFNDTICKENIKQGTHVVVRYEKKTAVVHYVGVVIADVSEDDTVEVKKLKRQPSKHERSIFIFPDPVDIDEVEIDDIVMLLPPPIRSGGTKRAAKTYVFRGVNLDAYKLIHNLM